MPALPPLPSGFVTRYAPAPTGALHLGHVANALFVWGLARRYAGRVLLRIEDHDRERCRPAFDAGLREDLEWLGFLPDGDIVRQSERDARYSEALTRLAASGRVYACNCTRSQLRAETDVAPGEEPRYPGTCRDRGLPDEASSLRRVRLDAEDIPFVDLRRGACTQRPAEQCGDLLVRDRAGNWTYQFAVVVDDLDQGVDMVIRGEDLLASTGRQIQLAAMLGRTSPPRFLHHGLIRRPDGRKLSKSLGDTGVHELRAAGTGAARVRGLAAAAVGLLEAPRDVDAGDELAALVAGSQCT